MKPSIDLPKLPIFSHEFDQQMAIMAKAKFNLRAAVNATKKDDKMFASMSHYLYSKMIDEDTFESDEFDPFSRRDWLLVALTITVVLMLIGLLLLALKF